MNLFYFMKVIEKCHDIKYIQKLKNLCEEIKDLKNSPKRSSKDNNFTKEEMG